NQVSFRAALLHSLNQFLSIFGRMQFQERLSKACGEGRSRLSDSTLGTSQFCCESGQEVVLCLLRSQDRYWRQYAECVCGQEDYFLSSRCGRYRTNDIFDVIDRIRYTGILCHALIVEINLSFSIQSYVFKQSVSDRKSTRLNSSHVSISYAVFCLKKKKTTSYKII